MGLGPNESNLYKLEILIVKLRLFLCIGLINQRIIKVNPKIFLWVNIVLNMLVIYVVKIVNIILWCSVYIIDMYLDTLEILLVFHELAL